MTEGQIIDNGSGEGGGGTTDWKDGMNAEYRDHASIKHYTDINALAKSHLELESKLGTRPGVTDMDMPTDAEARAKIYGKMGRPDSPDGYNLPDNGKEFRLIAHKNNLTTEQVEGLFKDMAAQEKSATESKDANWAKQKEDLEKTVKETYESKWGDGYDENSAMMKAGAEQEIPAESLAELKSLGITNEPWFIDHFLKVGQSMKEDPMFGGDGSSGVGNDSLGDVRGKRIAMDNDPAYQEILKNPMNPQYREKTEEYARLMAEESKIATKGGMSLPWEQQV